MYTKPEEELLIVRYVVVWYRCKVPLAERMFENLDEAALYLGGIKQSYRPRIERIIVRTTMETVPFEEYSFALGT